MSYNLSDQLCQLVYIDYRMLSLVHQVSFSINTNWLLDMTDNWVSMLTLSLNKRYQTYNTFYFIPWPTPGNWQLGRLRTKLYDKRCVLTLDFPFVSSNILDAPVCGVHFLYIYSRACGPYQDFLSRGVLLTRKPPWHCIPVSQMTTDKLYLSKSSNFHILELPQGVWQE